MRDRMLVTALALVLAGCGGESAPAASAPAAPLLVFAASSLTEVVTEAGEAWGTASGREVRFQFGASSTLARQVREGAAADIFVSADAEWLATVSPTASYDWLGNRLAVVVAAERKDDPELARVASLALGAPEVPVGKYARAALEKLGIALPARVVHGANVRDVLSKVAEGAAEAGIVYSTDVPVDARVRLASLLPESSHPPIRYAVGLLKPAGRELFEGLRTPEVLERARRRGFTTP